MKQEQDHNIPIEDIELLPDKPLEIDLAFSTAGELIGDYIAPIKTFSQRQSPEVNNSFELFNREAIVEEFDDYIEDSKEFQKRYRISNEIYEIEFSSLKDMKNPGIIKALDCLNIALEENFARAVTIPIPVFAERLGISTEWAYKKASKDFQALSKFRLTKKGKDAVRGVAIWGGDFKVDRDNIYWEFSTPYLNRVSKYPSLPININALKTDDQKYPNAYRIIKYLMRNAYLNHNKPNEHITTIETLSKKCDLPSLEKSEATRQIKRNIIEPIEKTLDYLTDSEIIDWYYCGKNGVKLTNEELNKLFSSARQNYYAKIYYTLKGIDNSLYPKNLNAPHTKEPLKKKKTKHKRQNIK